MITVKAFYKFICIYPWLFLFYFFAIIASNGHLLGQKKDLTLVPLFFGIGMGATLLLPAWLFVSVRLGIQNPKDKIFWLYFALFLVPTILLYYFLKYDPFNFWGNIVD